MAAIAAAARGELSAIVTCPVRKAALVIDGVSWPGQGAHDDDLVSGFAAPLFVDQVHHAMRRRKSALHISFFGPVQRGVTRLLLDDVAERRQPRLEGRRGVCERLRLSPHVAFADGGGEVVDVGDELPLQRLPGIVEDGSRAKVALAWHRDHAESTRSA